MQLKKGDKVIAVSASRGWGEVSPGEEGVVARIVSQDEIYVNFPNHREWQCIEGDLEKKSYKAQTVPFETVILEDEKKLEIEAALAQVDNLDIIFKKWGFGDIFEKGTAISFLFYGIPGTGKTLMAQAIADRLKHPLLIVSSAEIESNVPGEAERNIKRYFSMASGKRGRPTGQVHKDGTPKLHKKEECVLLFDECDSLITDRSRVGMILASQINTLLSELEQFEGVVVFTTNRLGTLDAAMERRITQKVEFGFPTEEMRKKIWKRMIPKKCPLANDVNLEELAKFPLAGGNIKNAVLSAARMAAYQKMKKIDYDCFFAAIEREAVGLMEWRKQKKQIHPSEDIETGNAITKKDLIQTVVKKAKKNKKSPL